MIDIDAFDAIGLVGALISVSCYGWVQRHRDYAKKLSYSILNMFSAVFVGISFFGHWNISAFIINSFWGILSLYGIYRCVKYHHRSKKHT